MDLVLLLVKIVGSSEELGERLVIGCKFFIGGKSENSHNV